MRTMIAIALAGALALPLVPAAASDVVADGLRIEQPWSRATAPGAPVAAGYMTITNTGTQAERLVGGSAPFAGRVEIHEMGINGDVMRMRELEDGLAIPPGETVTLEPGGFHVMFMDLVEPLREGETVPATLSFERAGEVPVGILVGAIGASEPGGPEHGGHGRGGHGHD